eukprot:CAMPEP_0181370112 /NCGR_PEP_ID=MMETSP1106-20121128/13215_1 /TAXON_ID=81844 /ORGANISM="Mantoniella antarctica, Strain SL-175" /LENGTH=133 /DNA_ID=CAMNT_0023486809 /DNA_START=81 /DNA_END=478 /DNA_ORIENTATION=+
MTERCQHTGCAARGGIVVHGGTIAGQLTASVEISGNVSSEAEGNILKIMPPLSCGRIRHIAAVVIDESESDRGQVLFIGGWDDGGWTLAVCKVDLATGACTAQPSLLCPQGHHVIECTAARLPDRRIICVGTV